MRFSNGAFFLGYIRNKKKTNERTKILEEEEEEKEQGIATKQTNMLLVKE